MKTRTFLRILDLVFAVIAFGYVIAAAYVLAHLVAHLAGWDTP